MPEPAPTLADKIDRAVQRVTPFAYRIQRKSRRWMRRALRKPRSVAEGPNLLPLLIQVLASFSKADGVLLEEEIDSSLGFLRYDYPETVYSELRQLFRQALYEQQDLSVMAQKLSASLEADRKIMLGVQLYDLISHAGLKQEQVVAFYSFMSQLGMAAQHARANTVEGAEPGHALDDAADEVADAGLHLAGGLVGEGDGEDLVRPRPPAREDVGDPRGERPGLAGRAARAERRREAGRRGSWAPERRARQARKGCVDRAG